MITLVGDLLDHSAMEAGQLSLASQPVQVDALMSELAGQLSPLLAARQQELACDTRLVPAVMADPRRLRQVLTNLLANAIRYAPEGAHLTVRGVEAGEHVRLEVADDGPGIDPELQARLFQPFAAGAEAAGKGGTGLGLEITRRLVEAMHGEIGVESTIGAGTTFIVRLPRAG